MNHDYEVGDVIEYCTHSGGNRVIVVEDKDSDIKNGRPGFDGSIVSGPDEGMTVWGYDYQIVSVRK